MLKPGTLNVHLDTDFGGDSDDAMALVMLLGWKNVEIVGITTNLDYDGRRAGCVAHYLELARRTDIPVVAGAGASMTTSQRFDPTWGDTRLWPSTVERKPASPGAAVDLLHKNIVDGATVIAIGALTNLALLEVAHPGAFRGVSVVAMAGWVKPAEIGLPQWGPEMDFNVQCDTRAAEIIAASADLTLVTLPATLKAHFRAADLVDIAAIGPIGDLLARQCAAHAVDAGMEALAAEHAGLPHDLLNFHYDPVACAAAVGWMGVVLEEMRLATKLNDGVLSFHPSEEGRMMRVVTDVDGDAFRRVWSTCVKRL